MSKRGYNKPAITQDTTGSDVTVGSAAAVVAAVAVAGVAWMLV